MKKILKRGSFLFAMTFIIAFSSCNKTVDPAAGFTYSPSDVMQYEEVQFNNTSTDATSYLWDFGNNQTTTEANPLVTFLSAGTVTVKLTATNSDGSNTTEHTITVNEPNNNYMLDDVDYPITTDFFWYQSSMGGDPYLRLISDEPGQDTIADLLKLYPNKGLNELAQTYTWSNEGGEGTYDHGYTADYDGSFSYDWTAIGKTGSSNLVIEMVHTDVYKITGEMILSVGSYDWSTGEFTETSTKTLTLSYTGAITPL